MSKLKIIYKIIVPVSPYALLNMHPIALQYALLNVLRPVNQYAWLKKAAKLIATADMPLTCQLLCQLALLLSLQL